MTDAPDGSGYLLYHSIGQYPGKAEDMARGLAAFAETWGRADTAQWPMALGLRDRFLERWRAILNAPEASLTTTENVTSAVAAVLLALPDHHLRGRTVLIAEDCFPSNHFLLAGLADRLGFTLRTVPLRPGADWVEDEDFLAAWTPDVGLALVTWISSLTSHRVDVAAMVAHGRRMGSLIGVDVTQGAGLLPFDVRAPAVDFAVSTSLKWMCGSPGAGVLYVAPDLTAQSAPPLRGWFSQPDPFNWDLTRFSYAGDIRRFDSGTPAIMAAAASLPALDWHARQDRATLLAHNRALQSRLQDGVQALGLPLASPASLDQRGGSLMLKLPDAEALQPALIRLAQADVHADGRGRLLRLSPGAMTTAEGVDRALAALAGLRKG